MKTQKAAPLAGRRPPGTDPDWGFYLPLRHRLSDQLKERDHEAPEVPVRLFVLHHLPPGGQARGVCHPGHSCVPGVRSGSCDERSVAHHFTASTGPLRTIRGGYRQATRNIRAFVHPYVSVITRTDYLVVPSGTRGST